MTRRFQFSLKDMFWLMLVVAGFFWGGEFGAKRERQRLASERAKLEAAQKNVTSWIREAARYYDDEEPSANPIDGAPQRPLPFNDSNARRSRPVEQGPSAKQD